MKLTQSLFLFLLFLAECLEMDAQIVGKVRLQGVVKARTGERIRNAKVILVDNKDTIRTLTNDTGGYFFELEKGKDYEVYATKIYQFPTTHRIIRTDSFYKSNLIYQDLQFNTIICTFQERKYIDLKMVKQGLKNFKVLDSFIEVLNKIPYITIEIGVHSDCRNSNKYNDSVTQYIAESIANYMIKAGIDKERLTPKGYGESQLIYDCNCDKRKSIFWNCKKSKLRNCTEVKHKQNGGFEINVLSYDYKRK
jgi:hypothetical protein